MKWNLLYSLHKNYFIHTAAIILNSPFIRSMQPYLITSLYLYFRVPTAAEVEKWKESFSHVMSSESKCYFFTPKKSGT